MSASQEYAAARLLVSARWYGEFERGLVQRHDPDFLERVAVEFRMSPDERVMLFLLTTGAEPAEPADGPVPQEWLDPACGPLLAASSLPGYFSNARWDLEMCNDAFRRIWRPEDVPRNTIRDVVINRRMRTRYFPNWAEGWGLPIVRQLRAALLLFPWEQGLERLHREVREATKTDPELEAVWEKSNESEYVHPKPGETRLINHEEWGREIEIKLPMTRPLDPASGRRLVWVIPTDPKLLAKLGIPATGIPLL